MTPCPSLPAQPQLVGILFSYIFYCTCTFYISPHIPHDTLSITTCTTTAGKYSIFMHILLYMYNTLLTSFMTPCPSLPAQPQNVSTLFSCTFYHTCTFYISPHIILYTLSVTTCTTTAGKYSLFVYILLHMFIIYLFSHPS